MGGVRVRVSIGLGLGLGRMGRWRRTTSKVSLLWLYLLWLYLLWLYLLWLYLLWQILAFLCSSFFASGLVYPVVARWVRLGLGLHGVRPTQG